MRPRVAVLIAAHCPPKVLKVTLGSWLQYYDGSYDADVYVGLHKNYHHYNSGIEEIKEMAGPVTLTYVNEINWAAEVGSVRQILRYSKMHALNLLETMKEASKKDFTHAIVLDHDLIFKDDFIGWIIREKPGVDMACSVMGNRMSDSTVDTLLREKFIFAPKPSAWHLMISRKMFDVLIQHPELVEPGFEDGRMYDTLSLAYHRAAIWGMNIRVSSEDEFSKHVEHVWSTSMNFGLQEVGIENYKGKLARFEREYAERFPSGISELLGKLKEKREE